ncbi:aspartate kinase [Thermodesulfobium acidiphilum]|uniref:Aspartokinase n=1 Tax=Thermodesulfobium acidiphilum TaxID=1794699 RepID=A0A2R4VYT7_THEAF|nr:aspartate kinase [Thermodesulfobium acidiphilum]AWB09606.1 aspartate kinase [Thermodesulfobium acidiphilum]
MLVVKKFGGTSVGSPERVKHVANLIKRSVQNGDKVVVVVSAMGDSTDHLVSLAGQITNNPSPREMDVLLSTGEQVSIALMVMALNEIGIEAISFTGWQANIRTSCVHEKARVLSIDPRLLLDALNADKIPVVAGFQGIADDNSITTLGRGGSDTTAVAIAAAIKADLCEIYTDVKGVFTTDPRVVKEARQIMTVTYDEMMELALLGAKVLHPRSVELAKHYGVVLKVLSSFDDCQGTEVREVTDMENRNVVTGIAFDEDVAKVGIIKVPDRPGIAYKIFGSLAEENINVDVIVQSISPDTNFTEMAFTLSLKDLLKALKILKVVSKEIGAQGVVYDDNVAKVSIVGAGMGDRPGVAATMFKALADVNINLQMVSTSEIKISCIIAREDVKKAVKAIHDAFNLDKEGFSCD